jgi:hypothetical protein
MVTRAPSPVVTLRPSTATPVASVVTGAHAASVADVVVVASGGVIAPGEGAVADNAPRVVGDAGPVVPHAAARRRQEVVARRRRRGRRDNTVMGRSGGATLARFHEHRLSPVTAT